MQRCFRDIVKNILVINFTVFEIIIHEFNKLEVNYYFGFLNKEMCINKQKSTYLSESNYLIHARIQTI